MKELFKKSVSSLLVLAMLITSLSVPVFADEVIDEAGIVEAIDNDALTDDGVIADDSIEDEIIDEISEDGGVSEADDASIKADAPVLRVIHLDDYYIYNSNTVSLFFELPDIDGESVKSDSVRLYLTGDDSGMLDTALHYEKYSNVFSAYSIGGDYSSIELSAIKYAQIKYTDSEGTVIESDKFDISIKNLDKFVNDKYRDYYINAYDNGIYYDFYMPEDFADKPNLSVKMLKNNTDEVVAIAGSYQNYRNTSTSNIYSELAKETGFSKYNNISYSVDACEAMGELIFTDPLSNGKYDIAVFSNDIELGRIKDACALQTDKSVVTDAYLSSDATETFKDGKDYVYFHIRGINVDAKKLKPVLKNDGGEAVTEFVTSYGNYFKLKKKSNFPTEDYGYLAYEINSDAGYVVEVIDSTPTVYYSNRPSIGFVYNAKTKTYSLYATDDYKVGTVFSTIKLYTQSYYGYGDEPSIKAEATNVAFTENGQTVDFKPNGGWDISQTGYYDCYFYAKEADRDKYYSSNVKYTESGFGQNSGGGSSTSGYSYFLGSTMYLNMDEDALVTFKIANKDENHKKIKNFEIELDGVKNTAKTGADGSYDTFSATFKKSASFTEGGGHTVKLYADGASVSLYNVYFLKKGKVYASYIYGCVAEHETKPYAGVSTTLVSLDKLDSTKIKTKFYNVVTKKELTGTKVYSHESTYTGSSEGSMYWYGYYNGIVEKYKNVYALLTYDGMKPYALETPDESYYLNAYNADPECGVLLSITGNVTLSYRTNIGFCESYSYLIDKYDIYIFDDVTGAYITKISVDKKGYYYFTKSDLEKVIEKDAKLNKLYTLLPVVAGQNYSPVQHANINYYNASPEEPKDVPATGISLNKSMLSVGVGKTANLIATLKPEGAVGSIEWKSADTKIATVEGGVVTGVAKGSTEITATVGKYSAKATVIVSEVKPVKAINWVNITDNKLELMPGMTKTVFYETDPVDATQNDVSWTSSDETAVSVVGKVGKDSAVITAKNPGTSTITLNIDGVYATITVTVREPRLYLDFQDGSEPKSIKVNVGEVLEGLDDIIPQKNGYTFIGWYTNPKALSDVNAIEPSGVRITSKTVMSANLKTIYAYYRSNSDDSMFIAPVGDYDYTGAAIKPEVDVYDGAGVLLTEGVDYSLKYLKNKDAGDAEIKVTGKGNYTGTVTETFKILPLDIDSDDFDAEDLAFAYKANKEQKGKPVLTWNGKKLKANKDYHFEYEDGKNYTDAGKYKIKIVGDNNFTGSRAVTETITEFPLLSKASIAKIPNQDYDGNAKTPALTVKVAGKSLVINEDYIVEYSNNIEAGKATVVIRGIGSYAGSKSANFKIVGRSIAKAALSENKIADQEYTGLPITPDFGLTFIPAKNEPAINLVEGQDYVIASYTKNVLPGKATILVKGINAYAGTSKKIAFKILPTDINTVLKASKAGNPGCVFSVSNNAVFYKDKKGVAVSADIIYNGKRLVEGKDYTAVYSNNKNIGGASVVFKGKKLFKGQTNSFDYEILPGNINDVIIFVEDMAAGKSKYDKPKVSAISGNYLTLKEGNNQDLWAANAKYVNDTTLLDGTAKKAGDGVDSSDKVPAGTELSIEVAPHNGNFIGEKRTVTYKVVDADSLLSKFKVDPIKKQYTGKAVTLDANDINMYNGEVSIKLGNDFEIIDGTYISNINKGTASVMVRGIGTFGGTKLIKFTIQSKPVN